MAMASGVFIVAAGVTGQFAVTGLPISPRRVFLKAATAMANCTMIEGQASLDVPPIPPELIRQASWGWMVTGGTLIKAFADALACVISEIPPPNRTLIGYVSEIAGNGWVLTVSTNTLTSDTEVFWIATA